MTAARTALIVDLDRSFAAKLETMVRALDMHTEVLHNGDEACERVARGGLALVVTELSLPRMSGFQVLEALRRRAGQEETGAVVVSSFAALRTEASLRKDTLGINAIIAKNNHLDAAMRVLRRAVRGSPAAPSERTAPPESATPTRVTAKEAARLAAMLDGGMMPDADPPDAELTQLVEEVAREFGVSTALISFVLEGRQWFKAYTGLQGALLAERGTARDVSFCRHVVESERPQPLIVPDAAIHPAFMTNPLVLDGSVRSYAGAPLITAAGDVLGTLCVIDGAPSRLDATAIERLSLRARRVAGFLELRAQTHRDRRLVDALHNKLDAAALAQSHVTHVATQLSSLLDHLEQAILLTDMEDRRVVFANAVAVQLFGPASLLGTSWHELVVRIAALTQDAAACERALRVPARGPYVGFAELALSAASAANNVPPRVLRWRDKPIVLDGTSLQMSTFTELTGEASWPVDELAMM